MIAAINHKALPFFDRVPPRVKDVVLYAFDLVTERSGQSSREAYNHFIHSLKICDVDGPTFEEYVTWRERVKNGEIDRPDPSHVIPLSREARSVYAESTGASETAAAVDAYIIGPITGGLIRPVIEMDIDPRSRRIERVTCETTEIEATRLDQAKAIVKAADDLFKAKVAGGYSPLSVALDDTIVAEALKEVIEAQASAQIMDADVRMTPGNKLVDLLLGEGTDDIDAKMVDILTIDMQQELCAILVKSGLVGGLTAEKADEIQRRFLGLSE